MSVSSRLMTRVMNENVLFSVLLELTYRCNLDCVICYNDRKAEGTPLAREQYFRLLQDLSDLQVMNLTLSGGEPLAHPSFWDIGRRARSLGFLVRIKSNGNALDAERAERLQRQIDPVSVELSLHGSSAHTHDRQTRVAGSFDRLIENIRAMRSLGLRVKVNVPLTAWNEEELAEIFELGGRLGVRLSVDPVMTPRDDGDMSPRDLSPSREALQRLLELDERRAVGAVDPLPEEDAACVGEPIAGSARSKHCGAGSSGLAVDPYGNVLPCVQWRRPIGNLHDRSIKEIWGDSRGLRTIRELTAGVKKMVDGHGRAGPFMVFCPGLAEKLTGSPLGIYEDARRRMELQEASLAARE